MQQLAASFPSTEWETIQTSVFFPVHPGQPRAVWSPANHVAEVGGVYAFLLPAAWFAPQRTITLHAPHGHQGVGIPFVFTVGSLTADNYGVVYVGRTTDLRRRWRLHLTRGDRIDGGQVKYGLFDCGVTPNIEDALMLLREHARIIYAQIPGDDNCANRDVLEMALCARFGPPFNIKSER
jgi:hypothetical protein